MNKLPVPYISPEEIRKCIEEIAHRQPEPPNVPGYDLLEYNRSGYASFVRQDWPTPDVIPTPEWLSRLADMAINAAIGTAAGCILTVLAILYGKELILALIILLIAYFFGVGIYGALVQMDAYDQAMEAEAAYMAEVPESDSQSGYTDGEDVIEEEIKKYSSWLEQQEAERKARLKAYLDKHQKKDDLELEINK